MSEIQQATWKPSQFRGKDGKDYWVYTLYGAGRGWYRRMYYTPMDDQYKEIDVEVIEREQIRQHKGTSVILQPDQINFEVVEFSRNPYVKKDGTFQVKRIIERWDNNRIYTETFRKLYGVHHYNKVPVDGKNYTFWPEEMKIWYEKSYAYLDSKQEVFIAEVENNQLHAGRSKVA